MIVLGLDSSTDIAAIGLIKGDRLLGEMNINLYQKHSERLLPCIKYLMQECGVQKKDLQGLAVTVGPGSFTGLRIGLTTIKTMAQFLKLPVVGLSTLEVIACNIYRNKPWLVPVLDARHQRVYTALFKGGSINMQKNRKWNDQTFSVEKLLVELDNLDPEAVYYLVGNGVNVYQDIFKKSNLKLVLPSIKENQPSGAIVAQLGGYYLQKGIKHDYKKLLPRYLKKAYN